MLVAAAAMTFASCQREEMNAPKETFSLTLTLNTEVDATKTYLGADNTVLWGENESLTLFVKDSNEQPATTFVNSASTSDFNGEASASFTFELTGIAESASYTIGGIYPESVSNGIDNKNAAAYKINLPATQNASVDNYDPSAFIMVLKPETVETVPSTYTASFRRAVALNKVTLTGVKENISSVEITVEPSQEGLYLAGRRYVDLTTAEFGEIYYGQTNTVTVNAPYTVTVNAPDTGSSIDVWFTSWGMNLKSGDKLTVKMTSATKTYTRTITANENGIKFVEGDLNTLKVNMASAIVEDTGDFSGEWLITGVKDEQVYAASAYVSGNNLKSVAISIENGQILEVDGIANCMMTLTKIADGDYAGMYTITDVNGKYLYAASSSGNQLKGATEVSVNAYWTVELQENGTYSIVASESSNRNVMQFNGSDATNVLFNCYSSASQSPVTLYPYSMVKADTTPRITVEDIEYNVSADDETLEFSYTTKNIVGTPTVSVADGATMTNVEADVEADAEAEAGIVTVIFDANAEEVEKTATLVLSYEGAESVYVTITQAAKAAEGATEWVSTSFANLKEGDQVVIVSTKSSSVYAMTNNNGTGSAPSAKAITYSSDKLTNEPEESVIWYVGVDVDNRIFYADAGKTTWLYCTGTNNGVRVGTNTNKTFKLTSGYLYHNGTNRYIGIYNNQDWRCYTSTTTNISSQTFKFFVKTGESGGTDPEPEEPAEPETPTYESLEDLVAAGAPSTTATKVNVTLENEEITEIYVTNQGYRNGVFLQAGDREIEIYCRDVPEEWVVGGTVSGTLTECDWMLYNDIWELCPEDWSELSYTAPVKTLTSIEVSGQTTEFTVGDTFEFGGIVTATYSDGSTADVTSSATFSGYNMNAEGSQTVTVAYEGKTTTYTITITAAQGGAKMWKLVTDASSLQAGDKLAIVSTAKGKVASATISSGYMKETAVTISNNSFTTLPSGAAELTLGGSSGAWTLTNASGKKLGATAVKKVAWGSGTTTWTITIASSGDATIQNGTSSYGRFLYNVGSPRFTTYTSNASSTMLLPQIYRYE